MKKKEKEIKAQLVIKEIFPSKDFLSGTEWPFPLKRGRPKDSSTALLQCCNEMLSNENSLSANISLVKERKLKRQKKKSLQNKTR